MKCWLCLLKCQNAGGELTQLHLRTTNRKILPLLHPASIISCHAIQIILRAVNALVGSPPLHNVYATSSSNCTRSVIILDWYASYLTELCRQTNCFTHAS